MFINTLCQVIKFLYVRVNVLAFRAKVGHDEVGPYNIDFQPKTKINVDFRYADRMDR